MRKRGDARLRWVGIDEAGYGPNLGPLVMTAVVAEAAGRSRPLRTRMPRRTWISGRDLAGTVDRAGGDPARLWVDDSKAILRGGKGRDRLETACLAAVHAAGRGVPGSLPICSLAIQCRHARRCRALALVRRAGMRRRGWPWARCRLDAVWHRLGGRPLEPAGGTWRLVAIESVVVGPARFNAELEATGSKAEVHFAAFARLLRAGWDRAGDGVTTFVTGDKHGGRHYYLEPLSRTFADAWIDRGLRGPGSSRYTIRDGARRLELTLMPRADRERRPGRAGVDRQQDGPGTLDGRLQRDTGATRIPGLRPTAGYPVDARRFRRRSRQAAMAAGCDPATGGGQVRLPGLR